MSLRFIIEEIENGYEVQEYGKLRADGESRIGGVKYAFPDWLSVHDFLKEPPFKEERTDDEPEGDLEP